MYRVETTARFDKEFKKLDKYTQRMIAAWIDKNLEGSENPRVHGKGLTANRSGQWRYRIGDYRLICAIQDNELVILALTVGHRRTVYDQQSLVNTLHPHGSTKPVYLPCRPTAESASLFRDGFLQRYPAG